MNSIQREQLTVGQEVAIDTGYSSQNYLFGTVDNITASYISVEVKGQSGKRRFSKTTGYALGNGRGGSRRFTAHLVFADDARKLMQFAQQQRIRESARRKFQDTLEGLKMCRIDSDMADKLDKLAQEAREFEGKYGGCW